MGGSGAVNAYVPINPPPATAPRVGLLPSVERPTVSDAHWINGITFRPERCFDIETWWDCPEPTGADPADKTAGVDPPIVQYRPWTAVADDTCSTLGFDARDYIGRARRLHAASLDRKVSDELWTGTVAQAAAFPNDYLTNIATAVSLGTAPGFYALGELQQYFAETFDGRGMVHVTHRTLNFLVANYVVRREGALWLDAFDNIVVAAQGYDGSGPGGTPAPVDGSRQWAYITPVINYLADDVQVVPGSFSEAVERTTNLVTFRAESVVAAFWGDCSHGAIEIDLCNTCCTGGS